jgi:hypothetical protein
MWRSKGAVSRRKGALPASRPSKGMGPMAHFCGALKPARRRSCRRAPGLRDQTGRSAVPKLRQINDHRAFSLHMAPLTEPVACTMLS